MEQLRLACLHPQMTQYWRGLANELQLAQVLRRARGCSADNYISCAHAGVSADTKKAIRRRSKPLCIIVERVESTAGQRQAASQLGCLDAAETLGNVMSRSIMSLDPVCTSAAGWDAVDGGDHGAHGGAKADRGAGRRAQAVRAAQRAGGGAHGAGRRRRRLQVALDSSSGIHIAV